MAPQKRRHRTKYRTRKLKRSQSGGSRDKEKHNEVYPGPSQCHPSIGRVRPDHGCLPLELLKGVAEKLELPSTLSGKELREVLNKKLGIKAPGERTFLEALPLLSQEKAALAKQYLRPPMPKGWISDPDMWLDSNNIKNVLDQEEEAYMKNGKKEFEFMGPFPIDFAAPDPYTKGSSEKKCLQREICEIRVEKALANGTKSIGIVYNLDPHYKSGSHWVANYVDMANHVCYYFDSYGMEPPPQVATFMKWLTTQDPKMKLQYNKRKLQNSNTECGMYCIYVIICLLYGQQFLEITRRKPKDDFMIDMRDWLFST
jgi:hypothetical protein